MKKKGSKQDQKNKKPGAPKKIGDVLTDLLAQRGYAQVASQEELQQGWSSAVGSLQKFTRAIEVKRGTLHVVVSNSVVMQELTFRKQDLVRLMAEALPDHNIKELRYKVGTIN